MAYHGLLTLGGKLDNPFRAGVMDLPCYEYGHFFRGDFEAICKGVAKVVAVGFSLSACTHACARWRLETAAMVRALASISGVA